MDQFTEGCPILQPDRVQFASRRGPAFDQSKKLHRGVFADHGKLCCTSFTFLFQPASDNWYVACQHKKRHRVARSGTYVASIATQNGYVATISTQIGYVATIATKNRYVATLCDRNIRATLPDLKQILAVLRLCTTQASCEMIEFRSLKVHFRYAFRSQHESRTSARVVVIVTDIKSRASKWLVYPMANPILAYSNSSIIGYRRISFHTIAAKSPNA